MTPQHEIINPGPLLSQDGKLIQRGYAKKAILEYNPEALRLTPFGLLDRLRIKEWDYYGITSRDYFFSITVANIGYMGMVFAYLIDFKSNTMIEKTLVTPFGKGCKLPRSSESGSTFFKNRQATVELVKDAEFRKIRVFWKNFSDGCDLSASLSINQPTSYDSIVMATPIGENAFYYNQKINCMPVTGVISVGGAVLHATPSDTLATLDWGRGVWEYESFWNWASASGFNADGKKIGINLGKGFGDLSAATENCIFIDGKMHKLGLVEFEYDPLDFFKPWRFRSEDGRLDLTMTPFFDRAAKINLFVLASEVHQMFGRYDGTLYADDSKMVSISSVTGWAEQHAARW